MTFALLGWLDQAQILAATTLAAGLGALIGLERRLADKPTGTRTHALVAASAALVVSVGAAINDAAGGDPGRSLHAVMTGIGFLGAAAVYSRGQGPAGGLTTAATVFLTAAVGVTVGLGAPVAATGVTALSWVLLRLLPGGPLPRDDEN